MLPACGSGSRRGLDVGARTESEEIETALAGGAYVARALVFVLAGVLCLRLNFVVQGS